MLPNGIKALSEPITTNYQWGSATFVCEQVHSECLNYHSVLWVWKNILSKSLPHLPIASESNNVFRCFGTNNSSQNYQKFNTLWQSLELHFNAWCHCLIHCLVTHISVRALGDYCFGNGLSLARHQVITSVDVDVCQYNIFVCFLQPSMCSSGHWSLTDVEIFFQTHSTNRLLVYFSRSAMLGGVINMISKPSAESMLTQIYVAIWRN